MPHCGEIDRKGKKQDKTDKNKNLSFDFLTMDDEETVRKVTTHYYNSLLICNDITGTLYLKWYYATTALTERS